MKWNLWEDSNGKQVYAMEHFASKYLVETKLSNDAKIIWSCDAESPFDAQAKYAELLGFKYFRLWHTVKAFVTFKISDLRKLKEPYQDSL
ncbi:MAG: hypothetical protein JAY85_15140 [Candidatus Thiodiazotropha weberae]|nr:hypothetical protein [Candidatus Thiodiazotropha endoloripes]MCG7899776.1 hypothetical protein [Candidatus Thiodiazotropha weberae]